FVFQAEDGIRDRTVTGVQTCALPIFTVGGYDVAESPIETKRLIGYLPENAASYPDMTVAGFLKFAAELRGLEGRARKKAVQHVKIGRASCRERGAGWGVAGRVEAMSR